MQQQDHHAIFGSLEEVLKSVANAIRSEGDWTLPILYTVCLELRNAAVEGYITLPATVRENHN